jgi:hypothetical protein
MRFFNEEYAGETFACPASSFGPHPPYSGRDVRVPSFQLRSASSLQRAGRSRAQLPASVRILLTAGGTPAVPAPVPASVQHPRTGVLGSLGDSHVDVLTC